MNDMWSVPGAVAVDGSWRRDILELGRTPPSMNANQIRSSWRGFHRQKKSWQDDIGLLLLAAGLPRGNRAAVAGATMRFPVRARRDPPNYLGLLSKALGDALVVSLQTPKCQRFIPDDDGPHYTFVGVAFEPELGPARTLIHLYTQPEET
jgi:hypothetical protein